MASSKQRNFNNFLTTKSNVHMKLNTIIKDYIEIEVKLIFKTDETCSYIRINRSNLILHYVELCTYIYNRLFNH